MTQTPSKPDSQNPVKGGSLSYQDPNLPNDRAGGHTTSRLGKSVPDAKKSESGVLLSPPPPRLHPKPSPAPPARKGRKLGILQRFYDLSISRKTQLIPFLVFVSLGGIVGFGSVALVDSLRTQLLNQAKAQVAVTDIEYNIKINQMGFGFRGQSDNAAIIAAAEARNSSESVPPAVLSQVKSILKNEINARNIEYATLVGKDLRIIANANAERAGEKFDPNNLVSLVFQDPQQIKASEIVSWSELAKESPPLPAGFTHQDALIRYTVTPVRAPGTGTVIGALVSGDIVNGKLPIVKKTIDAFRGQGYSAVYLRQPTGEFTLATSLEGTELRETKVNIPLPDKSLLAEAVEAKGEPVARRLQIDNRTYSLAAKALPNSAGESVAILVYGDPEVALGQVVKNSLLVQAGLSIVVLGVIVVLVTAIGRAIAEPVKQLQRVTREFSEGNSQARAEVFAADELGQLASTFNQMADSIETNQELLRQEAERSQLLKDITLKISAALNTQAVFDIAVEEIRPALKSDRVLVYRFDETWKGTVIAESVAGGWPKALGAEIADPCFADKYVEKYKQGRVQAIPDIYQAGLTECHLKQLEPFTVKANLVAPILVEGELLGLLIAHQCSDPRNWEKSEIDFFAQLATQVGLTLERANLLEQQRISSEEQRSAKEQLQKRALDLLMEVDPVSRGDLTIRARVTEDEIGTVADSYNSTIESLRKIVTQVQVAAKRVAETTNTSEASAQSLSAEAVRQAEEISAALERIQAMNYSARTVAANAEQAEAAVKQAAQTVEAGDAAMNQTVDGILAIQGTVSETAKKVKRLGESSQNISQVVNLISRFAAQTHLLALKASIEAARAGEEGQGFAVIADEVRSLAAQSAQATAEIETLTASIQSETNEVAAAMEAGTEQVAVGTKLVEETRQSLNQIAEVSTTINQLVEAIAQAAVEQSQASQAVTQTMADVAAIAENTSTSSTNVSASFRELLAVAQELQESVSQFKVK